jgi:GT2 family glycosyltransferase
MDTIFKQTVKPKEIVIVDDSTNDETSKLIKKMNKNVGISIIYIKKRPDQRGTTFSRNAGIERSTGEFIFFLDDDITVTPDYVEATLDFFSKHPKASAVQWFAYSDHDYKYDYGKVKNAFMKLFRLGYYAKDTSIVLSTMSTVVPYPLTKDIKTEYMGAGTSIVRRSFLGDIRFDEKLTGYALQEDLDFSYRLHKAHGNMYLLKSRKLHHAYSLTARMNLKKIMYTKFVYLGYIFKKNMPQNYFNLSLFWQSMAARIILRIGNLILRPSRSRVEEFLYSSQAIISMAWHYSRLDEDPNYFKRDL